MPWHDPYVRRTRIWVGVYFAVLSIMLGTLVVLQYHAR